MTALDAGECMKAFTTENSRTISSSSACSRFCIVVPRSPIAPSRFGGAAGASTSAAGSVGACFVRRPVLFSRNENSPGRERLSTRSHPPGSGAVSSAATWLALGARARAADGFGTTSRPLAAATPGGGLTGGSATGVSMPPLMASRMRSYAATAGSLGRCFTRRPVFASMYETSPGRDLLLTSVHPSGSGSASSAIEQ